MVALPEYLTEQTEEVIRQRMLQALPKDIDTAEGSYAWDALAPAAMELAQAAIWAQEVLRRSFAGTTFGEYLDLRCLEHGLTRNAAVKAAGQASFTGTTGTTVPAGTRVGTPADAASGEPSIEFVTLEQVTIGSEGSAVADIEATEAGLAGNVAQGAISLLITPVPGLAGVTNSNATTGGVDTEDDDSLRDRYLSRVGNPSAGGNVADYVNWAKEVPEVGGVVVVPIRDGPGTVALFVIDTLKEPASQALVDAVQESIAPAWDAADEAELMTLGGNGTSVDETQSDDEGASVKMVYDSGGEGTVAHGLEGDLAEPGIWQLRVKVKVDATTGTADLLELGVYNTSGAAWAKVGPSSSTEAVQTFKASDLGLGFQEKVVTFYWNGTDELEFRAARQVADTATTVWIDRVVYRSTFSRNVGEGKAPIGARVTVEPAVAVPISVSATLTIRPGHTAESVRAAVVARLQEYVRGLAFQPAPNNYVRYVHIGQRILDTDGVDDYSDLLVNEGTANIEIGPTEVAVLPAGSVTLT